MIRTITAREAKALREQSVSRAYSAIHDARNLGVRLALGRYPGILTYGKPDSPTAESRNIRRNKMGLPPLIYRRRRPRCRRCLTTIEFGERVLRFEADYDTFPYSHHGFIHAEDCAS